MRKNKVKIFFYTITFLFLSSEVIISKENKFDKKQGKELIQAIIKNDLNKVKTLVETQKVPLNHLKYNYLDHGGQPLVVAIRTNSHKILEYLLQQGANPNHDYWLKGQEANINWQPPLHVAAAQDKLDMVKTLVRYKADIQYLNHDRQDALSAMFWGKEWGRPAKSLQPALLKYFISKGYDPNKKDRWGRPLMAYFLGGRPDPNWSWEAHFECIKIVVEAGYKVNTYYRGPSIHEGRYNRTAMHDAVGNLELLELFEKHGGVYNLLDSRGRTAVERWVWLGFQEGVLDTELINFAEKRDLKINYNQALVSMCIRAGRNYPIEKTLSAIDYLIKEKKVDPSYEYQGMSAIAVAMEYKNYEIAEYLMSFNPKITGITRNSRRPVRDEAKFLFLNSYGDKRYMPLFKRRLKKYSDRFF